MISDFRKQMLEMQKEVYKNAKEKGWHESPVHPLVAHMLIVSEIAEASEEVRNGTPSLYRKGSKYEGEVVELADAVIRIMDYCESKGLDLANAIELKHEFNKTRPYRHGGKTC